MKAELYEDFLEENTSRENAAHGIRLKDAGSREQDKEFFIKKTFEQDPVKGYELLFRTYYTPLCSHAVRFVYNKVIAEDLVTEIFLNFWKKNLQEQITSSFRAYLFTSVRNKCFTYLKWEFNKIPKEELQDDLSTEPSLPDNIMEFDELYLQIEKTISGLPPQCQKVFLLSRFEGKSYLEIAEKLGISRKAVEAHISKALVVLRKSLGNIIILLLPLHNFF
ncbi:hypothetical protein DYBT9275_06083 [Dyadobacter sp. CECT 9275]|uniref:RNA polymerase sigma-70 factor n=1 Tax=Dyadobacter helix TaxID=2822344 RepID=A0A916NP55_9BACT|nr:RNA polymerase sigma-70 factor [Dyadobacter sp. CECT 9275]CAG5018846.1 hypothetical protein DYBT9275_06083 [Dyadobacter sp. CECT 9275]